MLHYALVFFVIALMAALFGFGGIATGTAGIAQVLFFVFMFGCIAALVLAFTTRQDRTADPRDRERAG
jgi:uncharacterized membrane protein YtjA (UPF0391 family)